jgi:ABC-2 type transport system permease protein
MFGHALSYWRLVTAYWRLNLNAHLEYRAAFISQALAMFVNNGFWLSFWMIFFARFPALGGWNLNDIITMWCVVSSAFGFAHTFCGNVAFLPTLIAKGQLDAWMLYPRVLLSHFVLGRMSATACGDALFGFIVYGMFCHPDFNHFLLFTLMVVSAGGMFVAFGIITGSLGFFFGNAERLSEEFRFALVTFGTYPETLFKGGVRLLLYTVIPAGFVAYLPVSALRSFSLEQATLAIAGTIGFMFVATAIFYYGLSRYESGNLMEMRG